MMSNPETAELVQRRADEHARSVRERYGQGANDPAAMMNMAMEKLALARKVLAARGLDEQVWEW